MTENQKQRRQEVPPHDKERYSDIYWASIYGTLCSFGQNETRLIWMRSSVFLVVHGTLMHLTVTRTSENTEPVPILILTALGVALAFIWYLMNYWGWMNQDRWYWLAARLHFTEVHVLLPTDFWATDEPPKPGGEIYCATQVTATAFVLAYSALLGFALNQLGNAVWIAILVSGTVFFASLLAMRTFCSRLGVRRLSTGIIDPR